MNKYCLELHQYEAWRNPSSLVHTNVPQTCTGGAGKLNHTDYDVVKRTVKDFEMWRGQGITGVDYVSKFAKFSTELFTYMRMSDNQRNPTNKLCL